MRKLIKLCVLVTSVIVLFGSTDKHAYAQTVDLREYVAGADFTEHTLSTGEVIRFSGEGGGSGAVRQYKNTNYEQFFVHGDGIYRREDTSWAPVPGFGDAICT